MSSLSRRMKEASALQPVDPSLVNEEEKERTSNYLFRHLVGSLTGRVAISTLESLRASANSVVCLSPWGDGSPLILPCVRFRDLLIHTIVAATGGTAVFAVPMMGPVVEGVVNTVGDSILVEMTTNMAFHAGINAANDALGECIANHTIPTASGLFTTDSIKNLLITLKFKHVLCDASLGYFRSSIHKDGNLFSSVAAYLSIEKGWFSPYLYASARRPLLPRSVNPDVIFCHGPWCPGDYDVAMRLANELQSVMNLCPKERFNPPSKPGDKHEIFANPFKSKTSSSSSPSTPDQSPSDPATSPKRMIMLVLGMSPYRKLWAGSQRPSESVINYQLLNGCPGLVFPVKPGSPLMAWDTLTLRELQKLGSKGEKRLEGVAGVLSEFVGLCIDWDRVDIPQPPSASAHPASNVANSDASSHLAPPPSSSEPGSLAMDRDNSSKSIEPPASSLPSPSLPGINTNSEEQQPPPPPEYKPFPASETLPPPSPTILEDTVAGELLSKAPRDKAEALRKAIEMLLLGAVESKKSKEVKKKVDLDRAGVVMFRLP